MFRNVVWKCIGKVMGIITENQNAWGTSTKVKYKNRLITLNK